VKTVKYHRIVFQSTKYGCFDMTITWSETSDDKNTRCSHAMINKNDALTWAALLQPGKMIINGRTYIHAGGGSYQQEEIELQ